MLQSDRISEFNPVQIYLSTGPNSQTAALFSVLPLTRYDITGDSHVQVPLGNYVLREKFWGEFRAVSSKSRLT